MKFNLYHVYILRNLIKVCKKIGVALIASIILSFILPFVSYIQAPESNESFQGLVIIGLFNTLLAYLIFGIPSAFLINIIVQKLPVISKSKRYFLNLFLYGSFGFLIAFIIPVILSGEVILNFEFFSLIGVIAALIYYHISLIFENSDLHETGALIE
ncbi:hypothetical protein GCM10007063_33360 [Lentibacillus kapialis]|uniref:Uncharacterized protein n=1 Tax=Lentibacillus kapialis TaxID=340214 RepID=A0A917V172_9BACI|nr:hypothetical protein [Lentibacillus kapialis]GGK08294.1 hypothetical protein GCM10007063_33360 [Lentibacillus kapialis]